MNQSDAVGQGFALGLLVFAAICLPFALAMLSVWWKERR